VDVMDGARVLSGSPEEGSPGRGKTIIRHPRTDRLNGRKIAAN
jgi:hypothetical protein